QHREALTALRDKLARQRADKPRDPGSYTATDLNPGFQARMKKLLADVAPDGNYDPAKVGRYLDAFKKAVVTDPQATFTVRAAYGQAPLYYSNQNQYFLHGLAEAGCGTLDEDWLANTLDPTPLFSAAVALTARFLDVRAFHLAHALLQGVYAAAMLAIFAAFA